MANNVVVNITARDLTRGQLQRIRQNFRGLGQDIDRAVADRTRQNFDRLRDSVNRSRRELQQMRGSIPDAEFFRLDEAARRAQRTLQRGFGNVGNRAFDRTVAQLRTLQDGFRDLDENGRIRVRVDTSALRRADAQLARWRTQQARNAVRIPVRPDVNRPNRIRRALLRTLTMPFRTVGATLGGIMSDGIGQGIIGGLRAMGPVLGPIIGTALVGAAIVALSFAGAAIAGALVAAIGGAFVALGGFLAFQADGVKEKWTKTLKDLKPLFVDAASGMQPVLEHARKQVTEIGKDFAPHFKQALDAAAPHVQTFMDSMIEGFRKLGGKAAAPLEEAFNVFLAALGPEMEDTLNGMGDALVALANTVRDNSSQIAMAFAGVVGLITTAIDIVNFFAQAWSRMLDDGTQQIGAYLGAFRGFVDFILAGCEMILNGLVKAFGNLPFIGEKIKNARKDFGNFRAGVDSDLGQLEEKFRSYGATMDHENRERILKVNIKSWENQLKRARADLKRTSDQKAEAKIKANIKDLQNKVHQANAELYRLNGKTAHTYVITHMQARKEGVHGTQLGYAHGGVIGAAATGGVRSNLTLVGEQGPELVDLPGGSRVRSNPDSRRLAAQGGGGGGSEPFIVQVVLDGRQVGEAMVDPLRKTISSRGGNVQKVLGRGNR